MYEKRDCTGIFKKITDCWFLEAKQEDDKFFFYVDKVQPLKEGKRCYVIGRKGMGKTAIAEYLYNKSSYCIFTDRLSFKNFPFNFLYSLDNDKYTAPNQYITIWKYVIYNSICKMMSRNEHIAPDVSSKLRELYADEAVKSLDRLVSKWIATGFGAGIMGSMLNVTGMKEQEELTWIEKTNILEDVIGQYIDDFEYYILIDELDEDYRSFETDEQKKIYIYLITSLFKAVQDIKARFAKTHLRPIIFLRSDIYNLIKDSDKTKWSDYRLDLVWTPEELYKMLCHRILVTADDDTFEERNAWKILFENQYVINIGNRGQKKMPNFDYITRSTHWRPRDYIHYLRECCKKSLDNHKFRIPYWIVKDVDKEFSEYLKSEIVDEITPIIPNVEEVFSIISQIRKQTFSPKEFLSAYTSHFHKTEEDGKKILLQLFDHGVIGNQPTMKGKQIFKHQYPNALFNHTENIIIHRGLYKALQIF